MAIFNNDNKNHYIIMNHVEGGDSSSSDIDSDAGNSMAGGSSESCVSSPSSLLYADSEASTQPSTAPLPVAAAAAGLLPAFAPLPFPLPAHGTFPPDDYYILCFWNLPLVQDLRMFRDMFVYDLKRSLFVQSQWPTGANSSSILEPNVFPRVRDEHAEWLKHGDPNGCANILLHTYIFVPLLNIDEGNLLKEIWDGREYHGKMVEVFWSTKFGKQLPSAAAGAGPAGH